MAKLKLYWLIPPAAAAEVKSLEERLASMQMEREFYDSLFSESAASESAPATVPREIADLAKNRTGLQAQNKLLRRLRDPDHPRGRSGLRDTRAKCHAFG